MDTGPGPIPTVFADDLKGFFLSFRELRQRMPTPPGVETVAGWDPAVLRRSATGNNDVFALWLRTSLLELMITRGVLSMWLDEGIPREEVFTLAASWPIPEMNSFRADHFFIALQSDARPGNGGDAIV